MGKEVAAPDTRNNPTTAASLVRHKTQYALSTAMEM
jgi:hypothetical protein